MNAVIAHDQQKPEHPDIPAATWQIINTAIIGISPMPEKNEIDFYSNRDLGDENPSDIFEA
ncbi:MAG: hypothetical protein K1X61_05785 [Chitinophagales bacterium]|nr:hypothetical protein [Chitinophagales bacterium]